VLAQLRNKYWIVKGRQKIKSILSRCVECKKHHGKAANEVWITLPKECISATRAFETTGVDFAGPLYLKAHAEGEQRKVYILLFTCAVIRSVHLELVNDMTVKSFINAFRRFISRRGISAVIMSDNAKSFKRSAKELEKICTILKKSGFQQMIAHNNIQWKFIRYTHMK